VFPAGPPSRGDAQSNSAVNPERQCRVVI